MTAVAAPSAGVKRGRSVRFSGVLLVGVVLVPFVLHLALNSYGPLTVDGAIRMAFGVVAGQTIAVLTGLTTVVIAVVRRHTRGTIFALSIVAVAVSLFAVGTIAGAGELLLSRLELLADVDFLNRS